MEKKEFNSLKILATYKKLLDRFLLATESQESTPDTEELELLGKMMTELHSEAVNLKVEPDLIEKVLKAKELIENYTLALTMRRGGFVALLCAAANMMGFLLGWISRLIRRLKVILTRPL